jgi:RNA polymerase sigma-70 factor (ECF subfamily)
MTYRQAASSVHSSVRSEQTNAGALSSTQTPASEAFTFAEIYRDHFKFVWSMARYMGVDPLALDDVVQDVFVIIFERLYTLEHPEALRSWIYGIVRRVVGAHRRLQRNLLIRTATACTEPESIHSETLSPELKTEQSERAKQLWRIIETIDQQKREVFVLAELEDMSAPEIAEVLSIPLNTVYSRLRAARQELEKALRRDAARTQCRGYSITGIEEA